MNIDKYFETIDITEIDRFVKDGQEENLFIEFKTVVHPNYNDNNREIDKKNISKAISGFANSSGGVIVWGIKAKENEKNQDIATDKSPIKELTKFLNILNRIEGQATTPPVTGIIHRKIELSDDFGFIVTYVPPSEFAPHMANFADKHYYKRSGDSFYVCEHYDIKDMLHRKHSAALKLELKNKSVRQYLKDTLRYELTIALRNNGRNFAKAPLIKVEINSPYKFEDYGLDGNGNIGLFKVRATPRTPQMSTYMGGQDVIVFPDLEYDIDKIVIDVDKNVTELPRLTINYMIVAENMEKQRFNLEISVQK
jgi:hypothetical protein